MLAEDVNLELYRLGCQIKDIQKKIDYIRQQCNHKYASGESAIKHPQFGDDSPFPWCRGCEKYSTEIKAEMCGICSKSYDDCDCAKTGRR